MLAAHHNGESMTGVCVPWHRLAWVEHESADHDIRALCDDLSFHVRSLISVRLTTNSTAKLYCARMKKQQAVAALSQSPENSGAPNANENAVLSVPSASPAGIMLRAARCVICGISPGDLEPPREQPSQPVLTAWQVIPYFHASTARTWATALRTPSRSSAVTVICPSFRRGAGVFPYM